MNSYLFHRSDEASAVLAPPPPEFAELSVRRALWQSFGLRAEEMTYQDLEITKTLLQLEAEKDNEKRGR